MGGQMTTAYIIWSILLILTYSGFIGWFLDLLFSFFTDTEFFESKESYYWLLIVIATMWIMYFLAFNTY